MGFTLDDLTPKRPATATTPITDFPSDNVDQPDETPVQNTATEPVKNTAIDTTGITGNAGHESFAEQPTEDVTKVTPNTGITIDWSRPYAEIEQNPILQQMKPYDIMRDYQKNGDGNWSAFMPWLSSLGDGDKTVAANEALKKKAERQAKMEQWSNFLMHLGNFFGTVQGAPSQKIESAQELTDRQRKIRESTDALRAKGYDQMMVNIWKDRQDKQAQMQAVAAAKANEKLAEYRVSQKNQLESLTGPKIKVQQTIADKNESATNFNNAKTTFTEKTTQPTIDKLNRTGTGSSSGGGHSSGSGRGRTDPNAKYDEFAKFYNDPQFRQLRDAYEKKYGFGQGKGKKTWNTVSMGLFVAQAKALLQKSGGGGTKRKVRSYGGKSAQSTSSGKPDKSKWLKK